MNQTLDLNGAWEFCESESGLWKPAAVPGCVQMDLLALGELSDPYYGMNETSIYPLEHKCWTYRKSFVQNEDLNDYFALWLTFEGIDLFSDIFLNGEWIGGTNNMFIPFRFDIGGKLRQGVNEVEVRFQPTIEKARDLMRTSPYDLKFCCESAAPYVRKAHYAFGWDWCPRVLQTGIWRPVYIELDRKPSIRFPYVQTISIDPEKALLRVEAEVEGGLLSNMSVQIRISLNGVEQARETARITNDKKSKLGFSTEMIVSTPELWYPNGMGNPTRYDVEIMLFHMEDLLSSHPLKIGIRMVRLLREKDAEGESFVFEVNGHKVFAKGANWIPPDNMLPRVTAEDYIYLVKAAKEANMNMFNVWGGGIYEDPAFYEACDSMGIMIWQTFMFHFAQYPDKLEWFREQVRIEAETVIQKLRNHPSIVLWVGECESIWIFSKDSRDGHWIYFDLLPQTLASFDPSRDYWPGNPYGGVDANSMSEGDRHSWDVYLGWQDYGAYTKDTSRFVSEFGVQGMPDWKTVQSWTPAGEMHLFSPSMVNHNKFPEGTERMIRAMVGRLGFPKDFKSFVYMSQFNQAEAIKTAVEHWRHRKFHSAGALFWMFNDCWPTISWSCIDYYKRKKGLYYASRRFFANILPRLIYEEEKIYLDIVSDELKDVELEIRVAAYDLSGNKKAEYAFLASASANRVSRVKTFTHEEIGITTAQYPGRWVPQEHHYMVRPCLKNEDLLDTVLFVEAVAGDNKYNNYLVFDRFLHLRLQEPHIQMEQNSGEIVLTAQAPAFGVYLEADEEVEFSDNGLVLEPGKKVRVSLSVPVDAVRVYHLAELRTNLV